jgi:uncharacterized membrane protein
MTDILLMLFYMSLATICLIVFLVIALYSIWTNLKSDKDKDQRIFK